MSRDDNDNGNDNGNGVLGRVRWQDLDVLQQELERRLGEAIPEEKAPRWNADPDDVRGAVAKLVLTLVEFLRQLLERQAIRRMEANTLADEEVEAIGLALMRLEETVHSLADQFGIPPHELNLDLGRLGRLI